MKIVVKSTLLSAVAFCQLVGQTVDAPLRVGGDVLPPVLVKQVNPEFSPDMRKAKAEKDILVHFTVDEKGIPVNVEVVVREGDFLTADPAFGSSAVEAVRKYRFRPATRFNKPVAVTLNVSVHFKVF